MLIQLLLELVGFLRDREQNKRIAQSQKAQQKSSPTIVIINNKQD